MFRTLVVTACLIALAPAALADRDRGRGDWRQDRHYSDRGGRGNWDRRDWRDDRRDWRDDRRDWRDDRRDWRRGGPGYRDRFIVLPPPAYGFRPAPRPRGWYPGWREPYWQGYRTWANDRYWYAEPGRPAIELSLLLPLF